MCFKTDKTVSRLDCQTRRRNSTNCNGRTFTVSFPCSRRFSLSLVSFHPNLCQCMSTVDDTFCIGQESTLGTINSLRLGRLPTISPPVEWSEINAALGHTLLLLQTISVKFGMRGFVGWKLQCKGSFSRIIRVEEGGKEGESYEL